MISVIIPTYNRAHLLPRAITSVINQTYTDWEIILVDDASIDDTEAVISKFSSEKIKYFKCSINGGNAVARNVGVKESRGDYIAFLDSDDEYHPEYLNDAISTLKADNRASFLWSGTRTFTMEKEVYDSIWIPNRVDSRNQFLYELHVGIGRGFLINKKCFSEVHFDERLRTAVDTDFLIRLRQKFMFTILKKIRVNIYSQPESVRANFSAKKNAYDIISKKHMSLILTDNFLRKKYFYKLFWLSLYDQDKRLAAKAFNRLPFFSTIKYKALLLGLVFFLIGSKKGIIFHKKLSAFL